MEQAFATKTMRRTLTSVLNTPIATRVSNILIRVDHALLDHSLNVAEIVEAVIRTRPDLGGGLDAETVVLAAFLHDLGKAGWPPEFFTRPLALLGQDWFVVRAHPLAGANAARNLGAAPDVLTIIEQHHERLGGGGYPHNLADPHPAALLVGACDAFCACLEPRPYRPEPLPRFEALREAAKVGVPEVVIRLLENKETVGNPQCTAN